MNNIVKAKASLERSKKECEDLIQKVDEVVLKKGTVSANTPQ